MIPTLAVLSLFSLPPVMPPSDVVAGQVGTCRTVFEGNEIETFEFKVKGLMRNFLGPGQDLVLIRLLGEKPEFTGVVAGMSGSPCSIDGKLLGALAYAFATFAKEPIAGITPIGGMLDVMKGPPEALPWRKTARTDDGESWKAFAEGKPTARDGGDDASAGLSPIATPLLLGGVSPSVARHFGPWLESVGFVAVAGGSTGADGDPLAPRKLEPGGAVAAVLVKGDVDIAATGTVTTVEGKEVTAFGHPFLGVGAVSVPMASAYILNTMASQLRSFKMSSTGPIVGELTQDRLTAIGGILGPAPAMIPVEGVVVAGGKEQSFRFEVARDFGLSPRFIAIGLANSLTGRVESTTRGTVRISGVIEADGLEPLKVSSIGSAERDEGLLVRGAVEVARAVATLWQTPFGPPPGMSVKIRAEVTPEPDLEWIEQIHLDRGVARVGDMLTVAVRMRKDGGPVSIERFEVPIPAAWAGQEVDVIVAAGAQADLFAETVAGDPRPRNLKEIRQWLARRRSDGDLHLLVVRGGAGIRSDVEALPFLPPSIVATLSGDPNTQRRGKGVAWEEKKTRSGVVIGAAMQKLKVLAQ